MTLHDVSSQLHGLSLDGFFNHERFTMKRLHDTLTAHMQEAQFNANHVFTNTTATNGFAFNFKIEVERGASGEGGYISSAQGGFQ